MTDSQRVDTEHVPAPRSGKADETARPAVPLPYVWKPKRRRRARAEGYLRAVGLATLFKLGDPGAIPPNPTDLAFLHRAVQRLRPATILEFGSGNSTVAMAHALEQNLRETAAAGHAHHGLIYSVESSTAWMENTRAKLPLQLQRFAVLRASRPEATVWNGELCHLFPELPDIVPDLIFVDGPGPGDIGGACHGLSFQPEAGGRRSAVAADPLLYESSLRPGAMIVVDGRVANTRFLRRNLKRRYRFRFDVQPGLHCFTLIG
jgi:hypothetical protein